MFNTRFDKLFSFLFCRLSLTHYRKEIVHSFDWKSLTKFKWNDFQQAMKRDEKRQIMWSSLSKKANRRHVYLRQYSINYGKMAKQTKTAKANRFFPFFFSFAAKWIRTSFDREGENNIDKNQFRFYLLWYSLKRRPDKVSNEFVVVFHFVIAFLCAQSVRRDEKSKFSFWPIKNICYTIIRINIYS